jgi:hypothetical protein
VAHTGQEAIRLHNNTAKERQMVSQSMSQVGKWSRRLVGGALVLALAGLLAPATTSAAGRIRGHEVIVIEDEAPWTPQTDGYIEPVPSIPSNSGVDSEGGSESGGGLFDGGGYVPSGGGSGTNPTYTAEFRLRVAEDQCTSRDNTWREEAFDDFEDEDLVHIGYVCIAKGAGSDYREWYYYEADGILNHMCYGDSEVRICQKDLP